MTKCFIIIWYCLLISNFAASQIDSDSVIITRTIKNIVFVSNETLYKYTKIVQQDGVFVFTDYPIDSIYMSNNQVSKSYIPNKIRYTRLSYNYLNGSDTIYNYFSDDSNSDKPEKSKNINKELKLSYILTQLGEPIIYRRVDSILRIIRPCDELNISNTYELVRLDIKATKILLYTASGTSSDLNGLHLINKDSVLLKRKDTNRIFKLIREIKDLPYDNCSKNEVGNSWLIECKIGTKYKRTILTYDCLRKKSEKDLCFRILKKLSILKFNNFAHDCKEPSKILDFFYY